MNSKTFVWLSALTVVVVIAAGFSVAERYWNSQTVRVEHSAFPDLADTMNDVAEIRIENSDGRYSVKRVKDKWIVVDKHNYPAKFSKIREMIAAVSNLLVVDAKTKNPKLYSRISVQDTKGKDFDSKYLGLKDASGKVLAELIIGNRKFSMGGGEDDEGIYFRRPSEEQAYLGRGRLELSRDILDWLDQTLVNVKIARIKWVHTLTADGNEIIISRKTAAVKDFLLETLPAGAKLSDSADDKLTDLANGLKDMELRDISPEGGITFPEDKIFSATYHTFKGLTVTLKMFTTGNDTWARVSANADRKSADAVKEAEVINTRTKGWVFKLWDYKVKPLQIKMKDLLEKPKKKKSS
ncbi:MAG: DUF4340 domain-containing protein [Rhodospirillaceae bacterium]|jgi:hypothetical protein|nr:DUF4340 domain-containing protein [Rhodospirillaceae bacterium]MBT7485352.1 DUF4340 domain-containing protein [Rhodospirillales bacterium]MBT4703308.1 DUF4340 domain-containing protein [Rhodospirillaceae bacterium]MBT5035677.1 DUF4340 domain-containing protein [Rhodospirillaceae bacterium]MBT6218680.1 DUF4340 domain-containing protein [Rhodospirillaceae bacterium]